MIPYHSSTMDLVNYQFDLSFLINGILTNRISLFKKSHEERLKPFNTDIHKERYELPLRKFKVTNFLIDLFNLDFNK